MNTWVTIAWVVGLNLVYLVGALAAALWAEMRAERLRSLRKLGAALYAAGWVIDSLERDRLRLPSRYRVHKGDQHGTAGLT